MIIPTLLSLTRLYRKVTPTHRGRYAGFRAIQWLAARGRLRVPSVSGPGVLLRYAPDIGLDIVLTEVMLDGVYEPDETKILEGLAPRGGTVIDVGANMGYFSLLASRWVGDQGRVIAFEPVARMFGHLQANIALNQLKNVTAMRAACSSAPGTLRMALLADSGGSYLLRGDSRPANSEEVQVITLDDYVTEHPLTRLDLIKIDVEGADFEVVKGARNLIERFRPAIWMECHFLKRFDASIADVRIFLEPLGYSITEMRNTHSVDLLCVQRAHAKNDWADRKAPSHTSHPAAQPR